eukprot:350941-Chlamydomonas_euryale.AAC.9
MYFASCACPLSAACQVMPRGRRSPDDHAVLASQKRVSEYYSSTRGAAGHGVLRNTLNTGSR